MSAGQSLARLFHASSATAHYSFDPAVRLHQCKLLSMEVRLARAGLAQKIGQATFAMRHAVIRCGKEGSICGTIIILQKALSSAPSSIRYFCFQRCSPSLHLLSSSLPFAVVYEFLNTKPDV